MAGRSPWGWLTNTIWGSPARKVTTVLMGAVVTPIWVLNLETLAAENGWNRLLVDPGPVSSLAAGALSILFSTQFQWAVIGAFTAIVVDGWFRFRTKEPILILLRFMTL